MSGTVESETRGQRKLPARAITFQIDLKHSFNSITPWIDNLYLYYPGQTIEAVTLKSAVFPCYPNEPLLQLHVIIVGRKR